MTFVIRGEGKKQFVGETHKFNLFLALSPKDIMKNLVRNRLSNFVLEKENIQTYFRVEIEKKIIALCPLKD